MKELRERKIGEKFKYRKNIVEVVPTTYRRCYHCQFENQTRSEYCGTITYKYEYCCKKHKCTSNRRTDKKTVYFKVVERLYPKKL